MDEETTVGNGESEFDPVRAAGEYVTGRYAVWTDAMRPIRDRWTRLEKRYMNYREDKSSSQDGKVRSNIGIPLTSQTVDTTLARIQRDFFANSPYGKLKPMSPEDEPKSGQMQKVINYQMRMTNFVDEAMKVIKNTLIFGTGHAKLTFDVETRTVPVPRMFKIPVPTFMNDTGEVQIQVGTKKEKRRVMETPRLVADTPFNFFYPPDAPSVDVMEGFIHRTWQTPRSLLNARDFLGEPLYSPNLVRLVENVKTDVDTDENAKQSEVTHGNAQTAEGQHKSGKLEFLEWTGTLPPKIADALKAKYYPEADADADWFVSIVNGTDVTLRVEPVPHFTNQRAFFMAKVNQETGQANGVGLVELVERLALIIDGLYNNIIDNINIINNRPVYINAAAGMKKQQVVFGPGKVWVGRGTPRDAVQVIDSPDISQSIWLLLRLLTSHFKEYTGVTDPVLATSGAGDQTATEFAGLLASAATRNALHERVLENTFLKPLFRLWIVFNQQYLTDEFYLRMDKGAEYEFLRVKPEDIQGMFDIEFEGSSKQQSAAVLASQIMQLIQVNMAMPVQVNDIPKLVMRLQKDAWEWQDAEYYLNPMFAEQMKIMSALNVMQKLGETKQSLNPKEAAQTPGNKAAKSGGKSGGGMASTPHNAPAPLTDADVFRGVQELNNPDIIQRQV